MPRLIAALTCVALAGGLVTLGYPYEYRGAFFVMHDHQVSLVTAQYLRVGIPLLAVLWGLLAVWNFRQLRRWANGAA